MQHWILNHAKAHKTCRAVESGELRHSITTIEELAALMEQSFSKHLFTFYYIILLAIVNF